MSDEGPWWEQFREPEEGDPAPAATSDEPVGPEPAVPPSPPVALPPPTTGSLLPPPPAALAIPPALEPRSTSRWPLFQRAAMGVAAVIVLASVLVFALFVRGHDDRDADAGDDLAGEVAADDVADQATSTTTTVGSTTTTAPPSTTEPPTSSTTTTTAAPADGTVAVSDLTVGTCVVELPEGFPEVLMSVDCGEPHRAEVVLRASATRDDDRSAICAAAVDDYIGPDGETPPITTTLFSSDATGNGTLVCLIEWSEPQSGSVRAG